MLHTRKSALAYVLAFAFAARNSRMLVRKSISWHSIGPSVAARNACWTGYSRWNNPFVARATTNSIPLVTPPQHPRKYQRGKSLSCSHDDPLLVSWQWRIRRPSKTNTSEYHGWRASPLDGASFRSQCRSMVTTVIGGPGKIS